MQRRDRSNDIECPVELVCHRVATHPGDLVTMLSCLFQHRRIEVDARHLWHCPSQFYREQPVAAPHIQRRPGTGGHSVENQPVIVDVVVPPPR